MLHVSCLHASAPTKPVFLNKAGHHVPVDTSRLELFLSSLGFPPMAYEQLVSVFS